MPFDTEPTPLTGDELADFENDYSDDREADESVVYRYSDDCLEKLTERIRVVMAERGLKQNQLAEMTNVAPAAISRMLKSPEKSKLVTIARLAKALDVDLSVLFQPIVADE